MNAWPKYPLIYEINTWVWLGELARKATRQYTLASVPDSEWDQMASFGFDAVWLMGVSISGMERIGVVFVQPVITIEEEKLLTPQHAGNSLAHHIGNILTH